MNPLAFVPPFPSPLGGFTTQSRWCYAVITVIEVAQLFSFFMHLCSKDEDKSRRIGNKLKLSAQNMHLYQKNYRMGANFILHSGTN